MKLIKLTCERCGHKWTPRKLPVKKCPECRSPIWDLPLEIKRRPKKRR